MKIIVAFIFKGLILIYQKTISPFFLPKCRYSPTCSVYAIQAINKHGPWVGIKLTFKRILTCHPWGGEGYDPVP